MLQRYTLLLLLLIGCGEDDQQGPTLYDKLEVFIDYQMADKEIPALSIALVDDQQVRWSRGFGWADAAQERRVSGETVYRVASVSKLFTAMAVMQLVEAGRLDLDAPITDYLPDFQPENPYDKAITLRQLHAHQSGLVREPPVGHYFDPKEPSLAETISSLNQTRLVYPPETKTKYSNAAVSVAGRVIEQVTGEPFETYMQRALLDPMGMQKSSFAPREDLRDDLGVGYMWTYDGRTFEAPVFELGIGPAANLYTTMTDLGRFMSTLFAGGQGPGGHILSAEALERMWIVQFAGPDAKDGFGLGFYVSSFEGERRVQHSGVMYGYATRVYALPDRKLGVAVVSNLNATNVVSDRIGDYALSLLLAEQNGEPFPDFPHTDHIAPERARQLAGRYVGERIIELIERDDLLYLFNGTEQHRLMARGDTLVVDGRLAHGYTLLPRGDSLLADKEVFVRTERPEPAPLSPALAGLVGEYGWDHNTLYLLERDGQLWALIEWFFHYPLTRQSDDVYVFPDYGLYAGETLTFTRPMNGRATAASLAGVTFKRRAVSPEEGNTFSITPVRPIETLRTEALAATPPEETSTFRISDLVELAPLDPTLKLDIRYASADNFMGAAFYRQARAFLQRPAAEALLQAQADLREHGLGLIVYDGYRPWWVTRIFWDATPEDLRAFVANPENGSRHNRGCAVDLGLYDLATGRPVEMPSGYDEFTARAYADYPGGSNRSRWHRDLLRTIMEQNGFKIDPAEWWHFDYKDWREYAIENFTFEELDQQAGT